MACHGVLSYTACGKVGVLARHYLWRGVCRTSKLSWMSKPCMAPLAVLQEGLFIGASVTQASLIDYLLETSSAAHKKNGHETNGDDGHVEVARGGMPGVYTALAHHLQRIAGNPVSTYCALGLLCCHYCCCSCNVCCHHHSICLPGRIMSGCNVPFVKQFAASKWGVLVCHCQHWMCYVPQL